MKKLDDIIMNNRSEFDSFEPLDGHFERFLAKQQIRSRKVKKVKLNSLLKIAAVLLPIFIITVSGIIYMKQSNKPAANEFVSISSISPEYQEIESYFQSTIKQRIKELNSLSCTNGNIEKESILNDLRDLDKSYQDLNMELMRNSNDPRIINAIILNYKTKADMLEKIIKQIKSNC